MKNTVKKILALVFVVAMVCSLAVPAFATEEVKVNVVVYNRDGSVIVSDQEVDLTSVKNQTVEQALKSIPQVTVSATTGKLTAVQIGVANGSPVYDKNTSDDVLGELGTGAYVVALNGKIVSEDLGNVAVADGDEIIVYWTDSSFPNVLAQIDGSNIDAGVISFYYYDAAGNRQPLVGAKVTLQNIQDLLNPVGTGDTYDVTDDNGVVTSWVQASTTYVTVTATYNATATDENGMLAKYQFVNTFTTDEKGQIWIAPQYLGTSGEDAPIVITSIEWDAKKLTKSKSGMNNDEWAYYEGVYNVNQLFVNDHLVNDSVAIDDMYVTTGATGDMTVAYVMVAVAAVITLGAVVVLKKKAVKAN